MNERIKELAEQARKRPIGDSWTYRTFGEFEEKFAELIIKECCDVAHHNHFVNRLTLGDVINKHFGSKE